MIRFVLIAFRFPFLMLRFFRQNMLHLKTLLLGIINGLCINGGVNYRTFVPRQNFHEKNEGIEKTLIKCDGNLLAQLLIQKNHFWIEWNMPQVSPKSAVLDPPPLIWHIRSIIKSTKTRA